MTVGRFRDQAWTFRGVSLDQIGILVPRAAAAGHC